MFRIQSKQLRAQWVKPCEMSLIEIIRSQRNINMIRCGHTVHEFSCLWFVVHVHQFVKSGVVVESVPVSE